MDKFLVGLGLGVFISAIHQIHSDPSDYLILVVAVLVMAMGYFTKERLNEGGKE